MLNTEKILNLLKLLEDFFKVTYYIILRPTYSSAIS